MSTFLSQSINWPLYYWFESPGWQEVHRTTNVICTGKTYNTVTINPIITLVNVTTDVNSNNTSFTTGIGTQSATVHLNNPSHPVCNEPNRTSFHINVNFEMPPNTTFIATADPARTYVTESGTLWQYEEVSFQNISYSSRTGTMVIKMRENNLNEFEDKV
jgi:hypothetical protein